MKITESNFSEMLADITAEIVDDAPKDTRPIVVLMCALIGGKIISALFDDSDTLEIIND